MTEPLREFSVAEAKAHLSALLDAVEQGEHVRITRRGRAIAEVVPLSSTRTAVTMEWFEQATEGMEHSDVDSVNIIRAMRDEVR
jgi:prevent-host-death family protein